MVYYYGVESEHNKLIKASSALGLLFTAFLWGVSFVSMKESLDVIPPIFLLAFRFTIATVFMLFICLPKLKRINKKTLLHGIIAGVCIFIAYTLQTIGCKYTTAGKNAFLTTVYVILVPLLGALLFRKKLNLFSITAAIIAIVGIGLISLSGEKGVNIGDVLTLIGSIFFAIHMILLGDFTQTDDVFLITLLQFLFASVLFWSSAFIFEDIPSQSAVFNIETIGTILFLGIFPSGIAFLLQSVGQKHISATASSAIFSLEAVFGAVAGAIYLHETMSTPAIFGCAIIFIAVILSQLEGNPFKKKTKPDSTEEQPPQPRQDEQSNK